MRAAAFKPGLSTSRDCNAQFGTTIPIERLAPARVLRG